MVMHSVAEQLHDAREAQKLSIQRIAELTNIKTEQIRALEEGNYNVFAAPLYVRGFVRNYAGVLNLDVGSIIAALDLELSQLEKFRERPTLFPRKRGPLDFLMYQLSKLSWRVSVPVMLGILLLAFGIWSYRSLWKRTPSDPLAKLGQGLYRYPPNSAREFLPLPTNAPP